ncbi:hypothetical protein ABIA30_004583 [Mycobacterium sp. MAA66]|uniref:hypothetical protein n=1 Tax=Mycobacterium sp. MAA66 TaxID=3156297 RepID=UPI0035120D69
MHHAAEQRVAAAVLSAFLWVAGPTVATAVANPGGGHGNGGGGSSHGGSSGGGNGHGNSGSSGNGGFGNGNGNGNVGSANVSVANGNGNVNGNGAKVNGSTASSAAAPAPSKVSAQTNSSAASGSSNGVQPHQGTFQQPLVTFGDGRNATAQLPKSESVAVQVDAAPAQMVATASGELTRTSIDIQGDSRKSTANRELSAIARDILPLWEAAEPHNLRDAYFGLTGLVLMPLAGLWVGYRQARAQRAAEQITRK